MSPCVADQVRPFLRELLSGHDAPIPLVFWDGSSLGPNNDTARVIIRSPDAFRRLVFAPGELGLGRALVAGDITIEGDIFRVSGLRETLGDRREDFGVNISPRTGLELLKVIRVLNAFGRPLPHPPEEARLHGRIHSKARDAAAVSHHYDVGNDFYRLLLGPSMTYSCAYFVNNEYSLEDAQSAKYELIARKLELQSEHRFLDIGCGWGGMVMHAARHYGVRSVGITLAREQADLARKRVAEAGLTDLVEIRHQDYRDIDDGPFDRVSSIGMFEHVGKEAQRAYFTKIYSLLPPGGRVLNHAISSPDSRGGRVSKRSFIGAYVFPDGQLHEVGTTITTMQDLGFEVRDVENLREHYALTVRQWVTNIEANWDEAVDLVGEGRAQIWRLYLALSAGHFEAGRTLVHQVLAIKQRTDGGSGMAATRSWLAGLRSRE